MAPLLHRAAIIKQINVTSTHDSQNVSSSGAVHMTVIRQERTGCTEMSSVVDETLNARWHS